tara:strand:- start:530 stop:799 length:270 start_codon:yes stop_codon:yes gene_type:complete
MNQEQELAALERIARLLEEQGNPDAPEIGDTSSTGERSSSDFEIDPGAINEAQRAAEDTTNQLQTTNALLTEMLTELQTISNTLSQGLS